MSLKTEAKQKLPKTELSKCKLKLKCFCVHSMVCPLVITWKPCKYRQPSLYSVSLSAILRICNPEMAFYWNLSSDLQ